VLSASGEQATDGDSFYHPREETSILKIEEFRGLKEAELERKTEELRRERFQLRIQQQSGQLEKPTRLREIRRTIARIETARSESRLATPGKGA
jgi:large subunit ribosomal protein L29